MSLRPRSGKWHYRFVYRGKEYSASTDLDAIPQNKREALAVEADALRMLKSGKRPTGRNDVIRFADAGVRYLTWAQAHYRAHPNSYRRIKTSLSSAVAFMGKTPAGAIDAGQIDDYKLWRVAEHQVRDITLRHDLHALSSFFAYAVRQHWAFRNPIQDVDIPSDADAVRIHVLTKAEEDEYFRRATDYPDLHDVCRLMINQGVRPEEATSLAKEDIDLKNGTVRISRGKTKAARRVLDMTGETRRILEKRMKGESKWIFPSSRHVGLHISRINPAHDRLVTKAAKEGVTIDWVPYDCRHTFATRIAETGVDIVTLASLLGHRSPRCVHKYVHPTAEHRKRAMRKYDRQMTRRPRQRRLGHGIVRQAATA